MSNQVTLPRNFENNCIELLQWDVNDKVTFNSNSVPRVKALGLVAGFSYNSVGELIVNVREFSQTIEGVIHQLHPCNTEVNLRNLTKEARDLREVIMKKEIS
jgi:hypothetical protein